MKRFPGIHIWQPAVFVKIRYVSKLYFLYYLVQQFRSKTLDMVICGIPIYKTYCKLPIFAIKKSKLHLWQ